DTGTTDGAAGNTGPTADGRRAGVFARCAKRTEKHTRGGVEHVDRAHGPHSGRGVAGRAHVEDPVGRRQLHSEAGARSRVERVDGTPQNGVAPIEMHDAGAIPIEPRSARGADGELETHPPQRPTEPASIEIERIVEGA